VSRERQRPMMCSTSEMRLARSSGPTALGSVSAALNSSVSSALMVGTKQSSCATYALLRLNSRPSGRPFISTCARAPARTRQPAGLHGAQPAGPPAALPRARSARAARPARRDIRTAPSPLENRAAGAWQATAQADKPEERARDRRCIKERRPGGTLPVILPLVLRSDRMSSSVDLPAAPHPAQPCRVHL